MPHPSTFTSTNQQACTAAAPTMNEKRTETNWTLLKIYLENDEVSFSDLELICAVCRDPMSVLPDEHGHREEDNVNSHHAMILPCGHIFGNSCIKTAFSDGSDLRPVCFICRAGLTHPGCKHIHQGLQMPCSKKDLSRFPTNRSMASCCSDDCFLTHVANYLQRYIDVHNPMPYITSSELMGFSFTSKRNGIHLEIVPEGRRLTGDSKVCKSPKGLTNALGTFGSVRRNMDLAFTISRTAW